MKAKVKARMEVKKAKKAFALFPILIVIIQLVIFNVALYQLIHKTRKETKGIEGLMYAIDYKYYAENFFDKAYDLAFSKSIFDFTKAFGGSGGSGGCKVFNWNGENYFSLDCQLKEEEFYRLLQKNLEDILKNYEEIFKIYNATFDFVCGIEKTKMRCDFTFNKSSDLTLFHAFITQEKSFVKDIEASEVKNIVETKEEIAREMGQIKQEKNEEAKAKEIKNLEEEMEAKGIKINITEADNRYYIRAAFGKRFLIDEGVYKEPTLNLYVEK
jgi:hypothetical protein